MDESYFSARKVRGKRGGGAYGKTVRSEEEASSTAGGKPSRLFPRERKALIFRFQN